MWHDTDIQAATWHQNVRRVLCCFAQCPISVSSFKVFSSPSNSKKSVQASRLLSKSSLSASSVFIKWKQLTSTQNVEWHSQLRPQKPLIHSSVPFLFSIKFLIVFDHERFAREILLRCFKHQNFASSALTLEKSNTGILPMRNFAETNPISFVWFTEKRKLGLGSRKKRAPGQWET